MPAHLRPDARGLAGLLACLLPSLTAAAQEQLLELVPSEGVPGDRFGFSVGLSGDRAIVGAPSAPTANPYERGAAYLFDATTGGQLARLTRPDASPSGSAEVRPRRDPVYVEFGHSVAVHAGMAVVGTFAWAGGTHPGDVYVFDSSTGELIRQLVPGNCWGGQSFGFSVAVSSDHIVVGAPGGYMTTGLAFVFDAGTGKLLFSPDPPPGTGYGYPGFGSSVAISGQRAVISQFGTAHVFDLTTGGELLGLACPLTSCTADFGYRVASSGERVLVGGVFHEFPHSLTAGACLFNTRDGELLHTFRRGDVTPTPTWSWAVSLAGDRAILGDLLAGGPGAALLFDTGTGQQIASLTPADSADDDQFGYALSMSGDRAVIGAPGSGSAYVFSIPQSQGVSFCAGDGATCTCANAGGPGEGCANSTGHGGLLGAAGSASALADELVFRASSLPPTQPALLFAGTEAVAGGQGTPFGDGLRCAGGNTVRLGIESPNDSGEALWGPGLGAVGGWAAGDTRTVQGWYRDPGGPCGSGFNLTNGLELGFTP